MNTTKIGFIGLGIMGAPMSLNLIKAGFSVAIYNRTKAKEEALKAEGASVASSPAALMQENEVIIIMVTDDEAIKHLFTDENGLLSANVSAKTIINMSTVSPVISREMAVLCKQQGNEYIDAPVSGSVKQAESGQLVIMVGGERSAFGQVKPILNYLGKLTLFVGSHGAGNTAKLAINTLLAIQAQGLAEATVFARDKGIELEDLFKMINNSAIGSTFIKIKSNLILEENYRPAFALKNIVKDLRLAKAEGLNSPLANAAYDTFQQAEPTYGEEDIIAVIKQIDHR
ncbi:NAD(P)-dependent oxidoreductase [Arcticibacter eurypsychrophilus]|uniref:NAD(P)-dependent oxidoreductase n=1 Tax=Arcticibacter eurypsychrophilus TaxID=1434752 RepID=UPI00084D419F|nr:NAD(P)-dependent oxidoreductase [Arcticibacter eurypsychrophilus]